ncbi:transcriptional repressor [Acetoanaerobium noterae]|uniref:Fur family transcriptional regulator n=1 Tax=Acetoanaerobium noterae TaxID=745369 RepID=UPI0028ABDBEC|nr:transcriptional repressor [Acetoanaerobium noterae]
MDDDRNNKTVSVWSNELQKIKSIIERENLKFTIQKQLILEALLSSKEHMTINELHEKLKVNNIGIATLYRNLDSFKNLGIITEINVEGKAYYEMKIFGRKPIHIHFKCTNCGKIMDIEDNKLYHEYLKLNRLIEERDLLIYDSVFIFKGICSDCKKL